MHARAAAERWRNGLGALLALVISLGFIKGRSDLERIDHDFAVAVAALLIGAMAANVIAGYLSLRAAHGFPRLVHLSDDPAQLDRLEAVQLRDTLRDLRGSVRWAIIVVVTLPLAMLVLWLAPPRNDESLVRVTTGAGRVCGAVTESGEGVVSLKERGAKAPTTIELADAEAIVPVGSC